jgi:zinc/manganese transport system substrate-binding protein
MRTILVLGVVAAAAMLTSGCGGASADRPGLDVVASTNVYGDIAASIGGPDAHVSSVLSDPNADPHLFEPGTKNGLSVARADVLIENGLGYDDFMTKLADAAPRKGRLVVNVADVLGVHGGDVNPHLWYDLPRLPQIARAIADGFRRVDPSHAGAYGKRLARFTGSLDRLTRLAATIPSGRPVAMTEPVAGYLLAAVGLQNLAPTSFTTAIENGTEPSPTAVAEMSDLLREHRVELLLYNSQAVSPITQRMREVATAARIPVVAVTETLPPHVHFVAWQAGQLEAIRAALGR